jgi:uncharacterized protein (TIGR03083 family)
VQGDARPDLAAHYRGGRERLSGLVAGLDDAGWATPVAACPGWDVRAVVSHLVGVQEDVAAGTLAGIPTTEQTDAQVARHRTTAPGALLDRWAELSPGFEALVDELGIWPAAIDVGSHEHDVRSALGRPGARDCPLVLEAAHGLAGQVDAGAPIAFTLDGVTVRSQGAGEPALGLRTSAFELFRLRLGRRSRAQVAALDWSGDPEPVLDALFVFGPRPDALVE